MKKLLILSENQFGYLMDTYYLCKYLNKELEITVLCQNENKKRRNLENINIIYKNIGNNFIFKHLKLIYECYKLFKIKNYDIIFIDRFRFCFFLTFLINKKKLILDIRTVSINKNKLKQWLNDFELKINTMFFRNISVITEEVALKFKLKKYFLLPLGAEKLIERNNEEKQFNLFYIGSLYLRNIEKTIEGFYYFIKKNRNHSIYYIVGDGNKSEIEKILTTIKKYELQNKVLFLGRKEHSEIKDLLLNSSIGVSFVPKTSYFENQPPTKTYEYLVNGMICIGTDTNANKKIINEENGVLCSDNAEDFAEKLEYLYVNKNKYNLCEIQEKSKKYLWKNVMEKYFLKMVDSIEKDMK